MEIKQKTFNNVTAVIFAIIAALHLFRLLFSWEAIIAGWVVPVWISVFALVAASYLAYTAVKLSK